jgi:hypothetical protein
VLTDGNLDLHEFGPIVHGPLLPRGRAHPQPLSLRHRPRDRSRPRCGARGRVIYLSDIETCYKLFRADLLKAMWLRSGRFGFELEATAYVAKTKARIVEGPINYSPRTRLGGKKIGALDGLAALWHLVHFNLLVSARQAFHDLPTRYRAP